jgi:hypothetical protein
MSLHVFLVKIKQAYFYLMLFKPFPLIPGDIFAKGTETAATATAKPPVVSLSFLALFNRS